MKQQDSPAKSRVSRKIRHIRERITDRADRSGCDEIINPN